MPWSGLRSDRGVGIAGFVVFDIPFMGFSYFTLSNNPVPFCLQPSHGPRNFRHDKNIESASQLHNEPFL
jgi:hypothetical protein